MRQLFVLGWIASLCLNSCMRTHAQFLATNVVLERAPRAPCPRAMNSGQQLCALLRGFARALINQCSLFAPHRLAPRKHKLMKAAKAARSAFNSGRSVTAELLLFGACLLVIENEIGSMHLVIDDAMVPTLQQHRLWLCSDVCWVDKFLCRFSAFPVVRGHIAQCRCACATPPAHVLAQVLAV